MDGRRILLLTLIGRNFNNNYGAVIQAYALQDFLVNNGFHVEILDYEPKYEPEGEKMSVFKKSLKVIREEGISSFFLRISQKVESKVKEIKEKVLLGSLNQIRNQRFLEFKNSVLFLTQKRYFGYDSLALDSRELSGNFDIFLVGSDQVWNKWNGEKNLRAYLLGFVRNVKKISYASSVSSDIPEKLAKLYQRQLQEFSYVSVREEESARELEKVLGYKPKVVVDPTLLLTKEQWEMFAQQPKQSIEKPYVFVYDLYRSEDILPVIEKLVKKLKINYVNYYPVFFLRKLRFPHLKFSFYTEGPREFLWLLKESNFVVTSSFHGVVFSIIFEKPFYAILWNRKDRIKQNGRIVDLLGKLGLIDRAFADPREILKRGFDENIDWQSVREKLKELRNDSMNWLLKALSDDSHFKAVQSKRSVFDIDSQNCAGCFACYNICPTNAIEMVLSQEGFYVPKVNDSSCTNCGLCSEVCPVLNIPSSEDRFSTPKVYVAWSLDDATRINSSSGGIYPELARLVLEDGGVVFAVGWNKEWLPEHMEVTSPEEVSQTTGSKYVQSKVGNAYKRIVDLVRSGKEVLFVGTPCQVAGLRNFMRQTKITEERVLTVDLVCLGVSSPIVFKKYIDENFKPETISSISFRSKIFGWSRPHMVISRTNGKVYSKSLYRDSFGYGFGRCYFFNLVCYNCPFSQIPRQGDITLGDFWGVPEKYRDERGVSVVLVNSQKGEKLFSRLIENQRIFADQVSLEIAVKSNPRIVSGKMNVPRERELILKEIRTRSWKYISKRYIKTPVGFRGFVRRGLSFAKRIAKKIVRKL